MKKILTILFGAVLFMPNITFGAFNDVTLATSTNLSVGGYTLNITGSNAVIQSIVVNTSSFSVTLSPGSSIQITSPTLQRLNVDTSSFTISNICTNNSSFLTLSSILPSGTVVVTPQSTLCSTPTSVGGNGPPVGLLPPFNTPPPTVTVSTTTASLQNQVDSLTALVKTLLLQIAAKESVAAQTTQGFSRNLSKNDFGEDVRNLQKFLNARGFIIASSGPGSPNNETTHFGNLTYKSLVAFQASVGLPSTGFFGPMTREWVRNKSNH